MTTSQKDDLTWRKTTIQEDFPRKQPNRKKALQEEDISLPGLAEPRIFWFFILCTFAIQQSKSVIFSHSLSYVCCAEKGFINLNCDSNKGCMKVVSITLSWWYLYRWYQISKAGVISCVGLCLLLWHQVLAK